MHVTLLTYGARGDVEPFVALGEGLQRAPDTFAQIPAQVWKTEWVVHSQAVGNGLRALRYLAPYIFRVAISNRRILKLADGKVTFRYRTTDTGKLRTCTLPPEEFSLAEAVWAYRGTPRIDRDFRRLKGYPLGIRPLYVQRDDHAQGMVRFLSLARRVLTLVKYVVMSNHTQNGKKRAELPGLTFSLQERDLARLARSQPSPLV